MTLRHGHLLKEHGHILTRVEWGVQLGGSNMLTNEVAWVITMTTWSDGSTTRHHDGVMNNGLIIERTMKTNINGGATTSSRHEGVAKDQQNKSKGWQMAGGRGVTSIVISQYWKFYSTIYSLGLEGRKCTIYKILAFENWSPRIKSSNIITDIFTLSTLGFYSYYDAMVYYTFN